MINWIKNWIKRQQWGSNDYCFHCASYGHCPSDCWAAATVDHQHGFPYGALVNWND